MITNKQKAVTDPSFPHAAPISFLWAAAHPAHTPQAAFSALEIRSCSRPAPVPSGPGMGGIGEGHEPPAARAQGCGRGLPGEGPRAEQSCGGRGRPSEQGIAGRAPLTFVHGGHRSRGVRGSWQRRRERGARARPPQPQWESAILSLCLRSRLSPGRQRPHHRLTWPAPGEGAGRARRRHRRRRRRGRGPGPARGARPARGG